ncbi:hypothetical protein V5799_010386 [Amblyomma americanum]|uniref:C2H2-type domain-containing protein n=1 Tax=Amblyomma americanum TaxID=6943 RepID=A0AAQ4EJZ2_AMBAM
MDSSGGSNNAAPTAADVRCPECLAPMSSNAAVASHCQRMHRDVHTLARCCGELFFTRGSYQRHCGALHPHAFVCSQCKTRFANGAQLKSHQLAFVKTYTCPMCGHREAKLAKLTSHVERAHAVILDQRYVLVDLQPRSTSSDGGAEKRRSMVRKLLNMTSSCCGGGQRATGSLLETLMGSAGFEQSYTCGFGSEDAYREPFVDGAAFQAVCDDQPEAYESASVLEETGESAVRFFDTQRQQQQQGSAEEPGMALKKILNTLLASMAAAGSAASYDSIPRLDRDRLSSARDDR